MLFRPGFLGLAKKPIAKGQKPLLIYLLFAPITTAKREVSGEIFL
jgi:hypothetical protein